MKCEQCTELVYVKLSTQCDTQKNNYTYVKRPQGTKEFLYNLYVQCGGENICPFFRKSWWDDKGKSLSGLWWSICYNNL